MSRSLSAALDSELVADTISPVLFYEAEFPEGWLRLWSGQGDIAWNGYTWTGVGSLIALSGLEEAGEVRASGIVVTLNGLSTSVLSIALNSVAPNRIGRIYFGALSGAGNVAGDPETLDLAGEDAGSDTAGEDGVDTAGESGVDSAGEAWVDEVAGEPEGVLLGDPTLAFEGRLDKCQIVKNANSAQVTISYESRLIDLEKPREYRWTDQDQQTSFPGDLGFFQVGPLTDKQIDWGRRT